MLVVPCLDAVPSPVQGRVRTDQSNLLRCTQRARETHPSLGCLCFQLELPRPLLFCFFFGMQRRLLSGISLLRTLEKSMVSC